MSLVAKTWSRNGVWGHCSQENFWLGSFILTYNMYLPVSCLSLAIKTSENSAASVLSFHIGYKTSPYFILTTYRVHTEPRE